MEPLLQSWQAGSLEPGPSWLARQPWGRRLIEGSIQPQAGDVQAGDEGDRLSQRLAKMQQLEDGIAAVFQEHQGAVGQPAAQLEDELAGPAGEFLGCLPPSQVIALRGARTVRAGKAQTRWAQGMGVSHIRQTQRRPLALTRWLELEATASR